VRNVVLALSYYKMLIYDTSIHYALEESNKYTVSIKSKILIEKFNCKYLIYLILNFN